jgi:predicted Zn finger-like uncharacterized protein
VIVACTSCPARYSVADAKIRGRKVRITCKHCGNAFVVDAQEGAVEEPARPDAPPPSNEPHLMDEAPALMPKGKKIDVHDEPTVIGRIPQEALDAERRFAQSTIPPPVAPVAPVALVPPVAPLPPVPFAPATPTTPATAQSSGPEPVAPWPASVQAPASGSAPVQGAPPFETDASNPLDYQEPTPMETTRIASPQARRASEASLRPQAALSADTLDVSVARRRRRVYWLLAAALALVTFALIVSTLR